ncbi:hypothetical protein QYE76_034061 [Lolium multiflorum]|uniref:RING-type domain-containing protein n=1 Tax=Lolium multiflorum TaxID=4521 RepID=A0AAD8QWM6_LOLMU|nr:hypothetical protein QYE76_034061 [Lolium multiflorum]
MAQFPPGFFPRFAPPPPPWFPFRPSPRPPPPPSSYKPPSRGRIIAGVVIFIVASVLLYIIVCNIRRAQRNSRARAAAAAAAAGPETPSESSSSVRVDEQPLHRACAASPTAGLPMFTYSQSVKHNVTGPEEETATCSVCLGALQLGETVRLLPACLHLYHAECIDPWLDAHSTCPICRSDTDPTIGVGRDTSRLEPGSVRATLWLAGIWLGSGWLVWRTSRKVGSAQTAHQLSETRSSSRASRGKVNDRWARLSLNAQEEAAGKTGCVVGGGASQNFRRRKLRASPVASPKASPKGIWGAPEKNAFQPRPPKPIFVRRVPIRCPAPEPVPSHGDAPARRTQQTRAGDPSARKAKTVAYLWSATLMASLFSQATQGRVSSWKAAWLSAPALLRVTTRCRRCFKTRCSSRRCFKPSRRRRLPPPRSSPRRSKNVELFLPQDRRGERLRPRQPHRGGGVGAVPRPVSSPAGHAAAKQRRRKMAVNGIGVPPPPKPGMDQWRDAIKARRAQITAEERLDPTWAVDDNDAWWTTYFKAKYDVEMYNTDNLVGPNSWNKDGRALFWGPRRTTFVLLASSSGPARSTPSSSYRSAPYTVPKREVKEEPATPVNTRRGGSGSRRQQGRRGGEGGAGARWRRTPGGDLDAAIAMSIRDSGKPLVDLTDDGKAGPSGLVKDEPVDERVKQEVVTDAMYNFQQYYDASGRRTSF